MDNLMYFAVICVIAVILYLWAYSASLKQRKEIAADLAACYGKDPRTLKRRPGKRDGTDAYFLRHKKEGQLDDLTADDLELDDLFARINSCRSGAGEEYLYYMLRTPVLFKEDTFFTNEQISLWDKEPDQRTAVLIELNSLGRAGAHSVYEYLDRLEEVTDTRNSVSYLSILFLIASVALSCIYARIGIILLIFSLAFDFVTYFKKKRAIEPYITSFGFLLRMMDAADRICMQKAEPFQTELGELSLLREGFHDFRKGSGMLMHGSGSTGSSNPADIVLDYLRILFHLDLIKFNNMIEDVRAHMDEIDAMITIIGRLDASISVASYRKSLDGHFCIPVFTGNEMHAEEMVHPLLPAPVANSLMANRSILLTGSNASGKSTFLKTCAISAIMAQSLNTVCATSYEAPFYRILTSMTVRDHLLEGESYYLAEVRSLKRIVNESLKENLPPVLSCIDEPFRGTNTVERVAASSEVLSYLSEKNALIIAATHDIELTTLLEAHFDNYHFAEEMLDEDVRFNFRLTPGRETTRNAIRLLAMKGFEPEVVTKAQERAEYFLKSGIWI